MNTTATRRRFDRRGFTLIELLAAIGIIAIIGGITAIGIRAIARDAKLSSASNAVTAALDNGRALAIRRNRPVAVIFRPRLLGNDTVVDVITAEFAGDGRITTNIGPSSAPRLADRYRAVPGVAIRTLPAGISVAGPFHALEHIEPDSWLTMTDLSRPFEGPGRSIGVLFDSNGATVLRDSSRDSHFVWLDYNNDGAQDQDAPGNTFDEWYEMPTAESEPFVAMVKFLAVYDYEAARAASDPSGWNDTVARRADLSLWINENADRIHFNRYTGVVMR